MKKIKAKFWKTFIFLKIRAKKVHFKKCDKCIYSYLYDGYEFFTDGCVKDKSIFKRAVCLEHLNQILGAPDKEIKNNILSYIYAEDN